MEVDGKGSLLSVLLGTSTLLREGRHPIDRACGHHSSGPDRQCGLKIGRNKSITAGRARTPSGAVWVNHHGRVPVRKVIGRITGLGENRRHDCQDHLVSGGVHGSIFRAAVSIYLSGSFHSFFNIMTSITKIKVGPSRDQPRRAVVDPANRESCRAGARPARWLRPRGVKSRVRIDWFPCKHSVIVRGGDSSGEGPGTRGVYSTSSGRNRPDRARIEAGIGLDRPAGWKGNRNSRGLPFAKHPARS